MPILNPKIFISHAWEDKVFVRRLEAELKSAGAEVWVDHSGVHGGDNLPKRISVALAWCDTILLVWSEAASQSHWVELEWTNALSLRKTIIPCVVSKTPLPALLANVLYVDCHDFAKGFTQLREALQLDPSTTRPAPSPVATTKDRRIDAAIPKVAEMGRTIDLRVQVRFPDSPRLGLEDWPAKNKPAQLEQAAETVALEFPVDATGKLGSARLEIHVVTRDFDIAGNAKQILLVPPDALSKCLSFLITPKRTGVCRLNVEVYNLEHIFLGAIPIETEVGGEAVSPSTNVANLFLFVTVGQEKAATHSGTQKNKKVIEKPPTFEYDDDFFAQPPAPAPKPASEAPSAYRPTSKRKRFGKALVLSAALGVLVTFVFLLKTTQEPAASKDAVYSGIVLGENENHIANATIEIRDGNDSTQVLGFSKTLPNGEFRVSLKAESDSTVWVKISKPGYKDFISMKKLNRKDKIVLSK